MPCKCNGQHSSLRNCKKRFDFSTGYFADVAQLAERNIADVKVAGSLPVVRSYETKASRTKQYIEGWDV